MKYTHSSRSGFTLIELLVVIAIIGILAGVTTVALKDARAKSRDAERARDIQEINNAIQVYMNNNGSLPDAGMPGCLDPNVYNANCAVNDSQTGPGQPWAVLQTQLQPYLSSLATDPCGASCPGVVAGIPWYSYRYVMPAGITGVTTSLTTASYQLIVPTFERKSGSYQFGAR